MQKICPLMSKKVRVDREVYKKNSTTSWCVENDCALYISGYTTEKLPIQCCAFEFLALKNAEGLYRV